jgi:hypothetical protein
MARYVVVAGGVIVGGPYVWDGVSAWQPPAAGELMTEADADAAGATWPEPEPEP